MLSRRHFLEVGGLSGLGAFASLSPARARQAVANAHRHLNEAGTTTASYEHTARDEDFWRPIQQSFSVDRSFIYLNSGGVSPSPVIVQDAMKRHLDYANTGPSYTMWRHQDPKRETVRRQLARIFGCDAEEIAITRNASESLQICQFGMDLKAGDEVLTTNQDYPRMLTAFKQRERREGVVLKTFSIPVPCEDDDEIVRRFESHITERTKLILMCHMINLTGQILPVKKVVQMARAKGIPVIVDGAHAFGHFDFKHEDLDCDYYATSLHKWLLAPHGTGLLYVRKNKIKGLWSLLGSEEKNEENIRKFEEIGTHPIANILAIGEAAVLHESIGPKRKEARLRYLTHYWAKRLSQHPRISMNTSLKNAYSCALANFSLEGVEPGRLVGYLNSKHIVVTGIGHEGCAGVRVTPNLFTTLDELDRLCDAVEHVANKGLPG